MHPIRRRRLLVVCLLVVISSSAIALIMYALRENMNLFYPPTAVAAGEAPIGRKIRVGGMVRADSIQREMDSLAINFVLTDYSADVVVRYNGILPDMFAEEEGAVATGVLDRHGVLQADQVLAKHDEKYMPPEVMKALEGSNPEGAIGEAVTDTPPIPQQGRFQ